MDEANTDSSSGQTPHKTSRREFLKVSGWALAGALGAKLGLGRNAQADSSSKVYLPIIEKEHAPNPRKYLFSVEAWQGSVDDELVQKIKESGVNAVRYGSIKWNLAEPAKGQFNQEYLDKCKSEIKALSDADVEVILNIKSTPEFARETEHQDLSCSPIKEDELNSFSDFVLKIIDQNPQVKYIELWNEPDVDADELDPEIAEYFGCWGERIDPMDPDKNANLAGGEYYAKMLQNVYGKVKEKNADIQVIAGALMMTSWDKQGKFLKGMLNGDGKYFDILSVHAYVRASEGQLNNSDSYEQILYLKEKFNLINDALRDSGKSDTPVLLGEGALTCELWPEGICSGGFDDEKAEYLVKSHVLALGELNLFGNNWYAMKDPGWMQTGLMNTRAYQALKYTVKTLSAGGIDSDEVVLYKGTEYQNGIARHKFQKGNRMIEYFWKEEENNSELILPQNLLSIRDISGKEIIASGQIKVESKPIIVESSINH